MTQAVAPAYAELDAYLDRTADARLEDFLEFLRIPTIGTLSAHDGDMRRGAEFIAGRLRTMGMEAVEVSETGGHPIVYAEWLGAEGAPTVVAYGHYDVQPVDPLELWVKPPFDPRVENGRVFARGAEDDKGQVHAHLKAAEAWLKVHGRLPVNLKFVFEGEEESASENLEGWLEANRERLRADLAVISDSGFHEGNVPAITVGLRGISYAQIDVTGPDLDLHSGSFGGAVRNPANALAGIIAALHDDHGRVTIPGFYDDVVDLSERDREEFARLPFDEEEWRAGIGVPEPHGETGYSTLERRGGRPTLDVNGIWGGFQGEGQKTIIPAHAHAKVSCRLVPDQDPEKIFQLLREHVLRVAPSGVKVEVSYLSGGKPTLTAIDHPATKAAARSLEQVFGQEPVYIREGGSIPVAAMFEERLGLPVVLLGFASQDGQAHAPNEFLRLANYEGGVRTLVRYWDELARTDLRG